MVAEADSALGQQGPDPLTCSYFPVLSKGSKDSNVVEVLQPLAYTDMQKLRGLDSIPAIKDKTSEDVTFALQLGGHVNTKRRVVVISNK